MLWIMSCSFPSLYFYLPVILVQVHLGFININKIDFRTWKTFLAKSNLAFLILNVTSGLHHIFICMMASLDCRF